MFINILGRVLAYSNIDFHYSTGSVLVYILSSIIYYIYIYSNINITKYYILLDQNNYNFITLNLRNCYIFIDLLVLVFINYFTNS